MDTTIAEVAPDELAASVEPGELTLVLGAPGIELARHLAPLGPSVDAFPETANVDEDELVFVDDFVSAVFDIADDHHSEYMTERGEHSLFARPGGAVLATRPRSFDWLCRSADGVDGEFVESVDAVVLVRTPPTAAIDAIDAILERMDRSSVSTLREEDRAAVLARTSYPAYDFREPALQRRLGWYDRTVTPAALLSLSQYDDAPVLLPGAVRDVLDGYDVSIGPISREFEDRVSELVPSGGRPGRRPTERSPPVLAAAALVAIGLDDDADWLEAVTRFRMLPTTAEALEIALDLPPGTIDELQVFAADSPRSALEDRLSTAADAEAVLDVARDVVGEAADVLHAEADSLEARSTASDEYGRWPLVGAWHWDGPRALEDAAADRQLPEWIQQSDDSDDGASHDWRTFVDDVDLLEAIDGGLVVLSGPKASGKRQVAASLAAELDDWGATVRLTGLRNPDELRPGIEATGDAVVVATYGAGPARIVGDDGVRALPEWVDDGSCAGALVICDDADRDRFDEVAERTNCDEFTAWTDRVEVSLGEPSTEIDREPAVVARDLLDAIGWNEVESPSRRTVEVDPVADQSTLAAIVGAPDHALDGEFLGTVVAEVVEIVSASHGPAAARQWLSFVDDLVADVALNRTGDSDAALLYRGEVYETAIAAVAAANPRTDEWVHAVARGVLEVTNETAAPFAGRESVGGDLEPFATAFSGALARLAQPPDGSTVNHGAVGCVDEALHAMVEEGWEFPVHLVYGRAAGRIARWADDLRAANGGISTVVTRVRQHAMGATDHRTARTLGNSFASMLGAVAGVEGSDDSPGETPTAWVEDVESRARDALQDVADPDSRRRLLTTFYGSGLGLWVFEHDCPDEAVGSFFDAVGQSVCYTATAANLEDSEALVLEGYGRAVRTVVQSGDLDRAERFFAECHRLVDAIGDSDAFETGRDGRAALHASGLAAFGQVERDFPDAASSYPYGRDTIAFEDSLGFEDWLTLYDASVPRSIGPTASADESTQYLTDVYSGALSTHVRGFDPDGKHWNDTGDGVTPRGEHTWYAGLTELIETRATSDGIEDPVAFLADVYGGAATTWAREGESSRAQEWVTVLVETLRSTRESIDGPQKVRWFDAFASTDAEILTAVLTRSDVGERTHDRLVEAVLSKIAVAAKAADNPPHPVVYVASVFGGALALAADGPAEEVRFGVTEVLAILDDEFSLEWIDLERAYIFERIYAEALARVGRTHPDVSDTAEWFDVVSDRIEATASSVAPEDPAEFVADVYVRALFEAAQDGADEWRRRLDAELRTYTNGPTVDDPAAFLEATYANVVVEGAKRHGPRTSIEACIDAVSESLEAAGDADLLRSDDALERTVSRAADTLSSANVKDPGEYLLRIDHGLRNAGHETVANDLFDGDRGDDTGVPDGEPVSNTGGGIGSNPADHEDR
ncbi:hypothetical protein [Salinarchaeum chitinilyticum]